MRFIVFLEYHGFVKISIKKCPALLQDKQGKTNSIIELSEENLTVLINCEN